MESINVRHVDFFTRSNAGIQNHRRKTVPEPLSCPRQTLDPRVRGDDTMGRISVIPGMQAGLLVDLDGKPTETRQRTIDVGLVAAPAADSIARHVGDFQAP
jgi:hypothetical protein